MLQCVSHLPNPQRPHLHGPVVSGQISHLVHLGLETVNSSLGGEGGDGTGQLSLNHMMLPLSDHLRSEGLGQSFGWWMGLRVDCFATRV
jgi:hypothetical protein